MKFLPTLFFSFITLLAFSQKNETAETAIRRNIADFSKNLVAGNIDGLLAAYTDDAKIFPHGRDILQGHDLRSYWTPPADRKSRTSYHRILPEEIKILGNEAYDWGYYEGKTLGEDGRETEWKGKYVIIWKEVEEGVWKIYLDIWNRVPLEFIAPADCMKKIIAMDDSLGTIRNHACETVSLAETIRNYAASLQKLDFSSCPPSFATAFEKHRQAWLAMIPLAEKYPKLRGEMHDLFDQLKAGEDAAVFGPLLDAIWATWAEVELAMKQ